MADMYFGLIHSGTIDNQLGSNSKLQCKIFSAVIHIRNLPEGVSLL